MAACNIQNFLTKSVNKFQIKISAMIFSTKMFPKLYIKMLVSLNKSIKSKWQILMSEKFVYDQKTIIQEILNF